MHESRLRVVVVYPDLLGTYGDGGNGVVLERRAAWRGIDAELLLAPSDRALPTGDLYCLGGGEDGPEVQAAQALRADAGFARALEHGAVVLAVCAGFQIAGLSFPDAEGKAHEGLGLLAVTTAKRPGPRMVGEVVAEPLTGAGHPRLPPVTGFENHSASTSLVAADPFARVIAGSGNGAGEGVEGAWGERALGTYLHGPVLARNPAVADHLLAMALGTSCLEPLDDHEEEALRAERFAASRPGGRMQTRHLLRAALGRRARGA